jgi:hypothetical protein
MGLIDKSAIDTAVVVPTLGQRPDYLFESLSSIRAAGESLICIVAPSSADLSEIESAGLIDTRVDDPKTGLPAAINHGFSSLSSNIKFITWLGDDDLLEPSYLVNVITSIQVGFGF